MLLQFNKCAIDKLNTLFWKCIPNHSEICLMNKKREIYTTANNLKTKLFNDNAKTTVLIDLMNNITGIENIEKNNKLRCTSYDINKLKTLIDECRQLSAGNLTTNSELPKQLQYDIENELKKLPNQTHPDILNYGETPKIIQSFGGEKRIFSKHEQPQNFADLCKKLNILRTDQLGNLTGTKSYYLINKLANLEHALIKYTVNSLLNEGFQLITVPDILPANIIEGCGMSTTGDRNQVYKIISPSITALPPSQPPSQLCLSGTSEMALAGYFLNRTLKRSELPMKLIAVSRCFRAETSGLTEERGIYRVHQFTKVEMFSVCTPEQSNDMLEYFREIEINLFKKFNFNFLLLDMPPCELGAPAYRKYDIEAWMPGRNMYGELSSCSNCTDYQSKRLNIKCIKDDGTKNVVYAHTVNGTACAVPRMLITILENYQKQDGTIEIPLVLQPYMNGERIISKQKSLPELRLTKNLHQNISQLSI